MSPFSYIKRNYHVLTLMSEHYPFGNHLNLAIKAELVIVFGITKKVDKAVDNDGVFEVKKSTNPG